MESVYTLSDVWMDNISEMLTKIFSPPCFLLCFFLLKQVGVCEGYLKGGMPKGGLVLFLFFNWGVTDIYYYINFRQRVVFEILTKVRHGSFLWTGIIVILLKSTR